MNDKIIGPRPVFLDRQRGDVAKARRPNPCKWRPTKTQEAAAAQARKKIDGVRARGPVLAAVGAGADTFGKIRKVTGIEASIIRAALRFHITKSRAITKVGARYYAR